MRVCQKNYKNVGTPELPPSGIVETRSVKKKTKSTDTFVLLVCVTCVRDLCACVCVVRDRCVCVCCVYRCAGVRASSASRHAAMSALTTT